MGEIPSGWELLHAALPKAALKALPTSAYGIAGLTDVNEGFLIQRLFASRLEWHWKITSQSYLGCEDRQAQGKTYTTRWYMAAVAGELTIAGQSFAGSGAHDNHKLDAAFKGANTVAFKSACKLAGLTVQLYLDGRAIDFIYADDGTGAEPPQPTTLANSSAPSPVPTSTSTQTPTPDEMVCPVCGQSKALRPEGRPKFCQAAKGGCGAPKAGDAWSLIPRAQWEAAHA